MVFPASRRGSAGPAPAEQVVCVLQCLHPVQRPAGAWHPDGSSGSCWAPFLQRRCRPPPQLTFYGLPVHQPLYRGLGVPVGSANQPAVLARGQNEVLGLVQPVRSSFKTHKRTGYTRSKPDQMVPRGSNPNHFVCCEQMQPESGAYGSHCP